MSHQMGFISCSPADLPSISELHHAPKIHTTDIIYPPHPEPHSGTANTEEKEHYYNNSVMQSGTFTMAAEQKVKVLVEASPVPVFPFSDNYSVLHVFRKANYS